MNIWPPKHNLAESLETIEKSRKFAFLVKPTELISMYLGDKFVTIDHIDMSGPRRSSAWRSRAKTKRPEAYNGPIWAAEINLYPAETFGDTWEAMRYFEDNLLGRSATWIKEELDALVLQYHFDKDNQPPRQDGIFQVPYIVEFKIQRPEATTQAKEEQKGTLKYGRLGDDLSERILLPPAPHHGWDEMPAVRKMADKQIAKGNYRIIGQE